MSVLPAAASSPGRRERAMSMSVVVHEDEASCVEREADPVIEAIWRRASEIARGEVDRTMRRIRADREVEERLVAMAEALVSELLRPPSARLRQATTDGGSGERLLTAAVEMFGLAPEGEPTPER